MKVLQVLNPILTDYVVSGSAMVPCFLGKSLKKDYDIQVDYVASETLKGLVSDDSKIYIPEVRKRCAIKDTIEYVKQLYETEHYDIVHIQIAQMSVLNAIHEILQGIPVVYTFHSAAVLGRFSLGYRESGRLISQDPLVRVVCPSKSGLDVWEQYIETKDHPSVRVVINGITVYPELTGIPLKDADTYIAVGRVEPDKRMLEIAMMCDQYHHKIIFVSNRSMGTVKPNEYAQQYQTEFDELCEKSEYITRYDSIPNYELRKLMHNCKGIILFSESENMCLSTLEGITSGLPLLYIEESSTKEVTSKNNSVMIPWSELYRKSLKNKLQICESYFQKYETKINNEEFTRESVKADSYNYKITAQDCAQGYYELYKELKKSL